MRRISADETNGINMTGQAVEIIILQSLQMVFANLQKRGDILKRCALRVARLPQYRTDIFGF